MKHEIKDLTTLPMLMLAGNSLLTFQSKITEKHFTFNISEIKTGGISTFPVRNSNRVIGQLKDMAFHTNTLVADLSPAQIAFSWLWKNVLNTKILEKNMHVYHYGRCARCGRTLTTPESIALGLGPECAKLTLIQR